MTLKKSLPIVVYDNRCYLCIQFAKLIYFLSRGKLTLIGHFSKEGEFLRKEFLDEKALDMFWVIDKTFAYGGRTALIPLLKAILTSKNKTKGQISFDECCSVDCKNTKAVFVRSASLITSSRKIIHNKNFTFT